MHSSFTFMNTNVHRVPCSQQQSGHPIFNIGAPASTFMSQPPNLLVSHPAFARSFASVVSCDNFGIRQQYNNVSKMNTNNYSNGPQTSPQHTNNNSGIFSPILKLFNKPTSNSMPAHHQGPKNHQNKEFEDFTHLAGFSMNVFRSSPPSNQFSPHCQPSQSNKSDTEMAPPSVNNGPRCITTPATNFVASLFGQGQSRPKNPRWYHRGFRCRSRGWRNNQNNNKFRHDDVNMSKNIHEKERSGAGKGVVDDEDFVDLMDEMNELNGNVNRKYETAHVSSVRAPTVESLPFTICSLDDFPSIESTKKPIRQKKKSPSPAKNIKKQAKKGKTAVATVPEKVEPEPSAERTPYVDSFLLSKQALDRVFPSKTPGNLVPILKNPTECFCVNSSVDTSSWLKEKARLQSGDETVILVAQIPKKQRIPSECSVDDDFIVFGSDCHDSPDCDEDLWSDSEEEEESDSDSDTEAETDDDEVDLDESVDSAKSGTTNDDHLKEEERDLESGFHEPTKKKVHFNEVVRLRPLQVYPIASKAARQCYWETIARDHQRFKDRIARSVKYLGNIFDNEHRARIYRERFQDQEN